MADLITVLATALVMMAGFLIYRRDEKINARLKALEEENKRLLEANRKRMPYRSVEHLLDAMAALDAEERELEIKRVFLENARAHLTEAMAEGTTRETVR